MHPTSDGEPQVRSLNGPGTSTRSETSLFQTDRLRFRPYALRDEAALFELFADHEARAFYPEMDDVANIRAWIEWNLRNYQEFGFGLWALELKRTGAFIGDCGLTYQEVEGSRELEVGYHVIKSQRGKGYATEAARACLNYGFQKTPCGIICSIVSPLNMASQAVAGRIHTSQRSFIKNGQPAILFFTDRSSWISSQ
jgi:ribosomal-protein-alanine N-acetyltransferase